MRDPYYLLRGRDTGFDLLPAFPGFLLLMALDIRHYQVYLQQLLLLLRQSLRLQGLRNAIRKLVPVQVPDQRLYYLLV